MLTNETLLESVESFQKIIFVHLKKAEIKSDIIRWKT